MKKTGQMSKTDAAFEILKSEKREMAYEEIIRIAIKKRLIKTTGKTPWDTLRVDIRNEINRGKRKRFVITKNGVKLLSKFV